MNGRQRNATNAQIWGKYNDSNYDGNCISRHCLSGTYEISGRLIFVEQCVHIKQVFLHTQAIFIILPGWLEQITYLSIISKTNEY
jgi:hypothetical protein